MTLVPFPTFSFTKAAFLVISVPLALEGTFFVCYSYRDFVVIDNSVLSAWNNHHSRKLCFSPDSFYREWGWGSVGGGWGGGGVGKGCYIFSILVYTVEYFTVVKFNIILLKPKTSGSLRSIWKCVKAWFAQFREIEKSVIFLRLLHIEVFLGKILL